MSGAALVTGAEGFVGSHLVPLLEASGREVVPVRHPASPEPRYGRGWRAVDLRDPQTCAALVRDARPACVIHLAAVAFPPDAAADPLEALRVNYVAVDALARAIADHTPAARLLFVGSGEVYGGAPLGSKPFREDAPLLPPTLYSATKAAAERRIALAVACGSLDAVCARPFNHTGPGRPERYAESSFARQLAAIERGSAEPVLRVGNLDSVRDFSDVRDVARAYLVLLERGERGGIYNVASGVGRKVAAVVEVLRARTRRALRVEVDPARFRASPPERQALVGDPGRLQELGWRPVHSFEETLSDLLEAWRAAA